MQESYSNMKFANVTIADESGCVVLRLVTGQFEALSEGMIIEVRNSKVNVVNDKVRLEIDPWGKIILKTELQLGPVNSDNNKSLQIFKIVEEDEEEAVKN